MRPERDPARINEEFSELLEEVRVAIPGAEVLVVLVRITHNATNSRPLSHPGADRHAVE